MYRIGRGDSECAALADFVLSVFILREYTVYYKFHSIMTFQDPGYH